MLDYPGSKEVVSCRQQYLNYYASDFHDFGIILSTIIYSKNLIPGPLRCKMLIFCFFWLPSSMPSKYFKMLNDAKVASLGLFKGKVCLTRFSKEKKSSELNSRSSQM